MPAIVWIVAPLFPGPEFPVLVSSFMLSARWPRPLEIMVAPETWIESFGETRFRVLPSTCFSSIEEVSDGSPARCAVNRDRWREELAVSSETPLVFPYATAREAVALLAMPAGHLGRAAVVLPADPTILESVDARLASGSVWILFTEATAAERRRASKSRAALERAGFPRTSILMAELDRGTPAEPSQGKIDGEMISVFLPSDPSATSRARAAGLTVQSAAPRSKLAAALDRLADSCAGVFEKGDSAGPGARVALDSSGAETLVTARVWRKTLSDRETVSDLPSVIDAELGRAARDFGMLRLPGDEGGLLRRRVLGAVSGLGPLEHLLAQPDTSEVMINGTGAVFAERGGRIEPVPDRFVDAAHLRAVIDRMVARAGRRIDYASPLCDVRLEDGSRVNVVLSPVALDGPYVTVRKFVPRFRGMDDFLSTETLTARQAEILVDAVRERSNIVIAGNSGSGKTTLLNILSAAIAPEERIITLEDAAELRLQQPHVLRLETRPPNLEGVGEIPMARLVMNALRMRPDRIIVGECRGPEVVPMLQALNTGHDGSMTTVHANSAVDALERLESLTLLGAPHWPLEVVRRQIASALDLVVYLKRERGERRLEEIVRLTLVDGRWKPEIVL